MGGYQALYINESEIHFRIRFAKFANSNSNFTSILCEWIEFANLAHKLSWNSIRPTAILIHEIEGKWKIKHLFLFFCIAHVTDQDSFKLYGRAIWGIVFGNRISTVLFQESVNWIRESNLNSFVPRIGESNSSFLSWWSVMNRIYWIPFQTSAYNACLKRYTLKLLSEPKSLL